MALRKAPWGQEGIGGGERNPSRLKGSRPPSERGPAPSNPVFYQNRIHFNLLRGLIGGG